MASAKSRARFPYSARQDGARTYAQTANGRELLFTGPAGDKARAAAQAQAATYDARPGAYDAHVYQMAADAANPFAMPRTARGGARDMAPADAIPQEAPAVLDASMTAAPSPAKIPTLAESVENRAYVEGPGVGWDTTVPTPEAERRRKAAALQGARVRQGGDVHYKADDDLTPVL